MTIKLTYPVKLHEPEDLRPLYEEFKHLYPEIISKWCELGEDLRSNDPEPYAPIEIGRAHV